MICSKKEIGKRIAELREARGLSQQELSYSLNVNREVVAKWENGTRDLKTEYTIVLADYFNVTCDYILRGVKAENVDINKELGLSDKAIEKLSIYKKYEKVFEHAMHGDDESPEYFQMELEIKKIRNYLDLSFPTVAKKAEILKAINILLENEDNFWIIENISMYLLSEFISADKDSESDYFKVTNKITKLYQEIKYNDISDSYLSKVQAQLSKLKDSILKEYEPNK